MKENNSI